jgi:hypothetical protein
VPSIPEDIDSGLTILNPLAGIEAEGADKAASAVSSAASDAENAASSAASNILGLPTLSNLRGLVIRGAKVIVGLLLIAIGAVKLLDIQHSAVPGIVAKGAAIA